MILKNKIKKKLTLQILKELQILDLQRPAQEKQMILRLQMKSQERQKNPKMMPREMRKTILY